MTQDKSVKLSVLKISNALKILCWHCVKAGITPYNDYRRLASTIIEMSEKWKVKRPRNPSE